MKNYPNRIVYFSVWASIEDAKNFLIGKPVKIPGEAGVKAPEFIYLEQLEVGPS